MLKRNPPGGPAPGLFVIPIAVFFALLLRTPLMTLPFPKHMMMRRHDGMPMCGMSMCSGPERGGRTGLK